MWARALDQEAVPTTTLGNLLQPRPWCLVVPTNYNPSPLAPSGSDCVVPMAAVSTRTAAHHDTCSARSACSAITRRHAVGRAIVETLTACQVYSMNGRTSPAGSSQFPEPLPRTRDTECGHPMSQSLFHPAEHARVPLCSRPRVNPYIDEAVAAYVKRF